MEYNAHDLAVREQAFKEAYQRVAEIAADLRNESEGYLPNWRTESTANAVEFAAEMVNGLAGWARAERDALDDALDNG
ncbi:hypothetical protein [Streptomyces sp. NPDC005969]|uniref:hypothetical protein n=1 Tax=Streptomyces sp. NPDC005969 TaxID=3156722 RepID=UPI0033CFFEAF